jgi:twitching motility protein PilT
MVIDDLLRAALESGASDLHLKVGSPPMLRLHGVLTPVPGERPLTAEDTLAAAATVLPALQRTRFDTTGDADFAYSVAGLSRFRCSLFRQRGTPALVLRMIPRRVPTIDELLLPSSIRRITEFQRGLVLVTGASGSGKSTTLAAIVEVLNMTRAAHIVTIEDPIEYLHRDIRSLVNQREVAVDTRSFADALRSALRQDPDIIMVGEMRDHETIETALAAAETGHLVLSTLHTLDATETISRVVSVFPPHQQHQARIQLASVLRAVVSQRLIPRSDVAGRCPAVEIMMVTPFIRDCISDPARLEQIGDAIAGGGSQYGMQTFDQSLHQLYNRGLINEEEALRWASSPDELRMRMQGIAPSVEQVVVTERDLDAQFS